MLNHKQTAVALAAIVLMIFSTAVPGAYAQLHGSPTYPGSNPIIHNYISPAANVAFSTSVPGAYAQLHSSPTYPGSHPIIQLFVRPAAAAAAAAAAVVGLIIAQIKCHTILKQNSWIGTSDGAAYA
jgi:hypothetical protein